MSEAGFRHRIGTCLYDLFRPYECNDAPDVTVTHTIVKRTARFVYVREYFDRPSEPLWARVRGLVRFSIDELERKGRAWNGAHRMALYTRPLPDWPLMDAVVTKPETLALTAGSQP